MFSGTPKARRAKRGRPGRWVLETNPLTPKAILRDTGGAGVIYLDRRDLRRLARQMLAAERELLAREMDVRIALTDRRPAGVGR